MRIMLLPVAPCWQLFTVLFWEHWFTPTAWTVALMLFRRRTEKKPAPYVVAIGSQLGTYCVGNASLDGTVAKQRTYNLSFSFFHAHCLMNVGCSIRQAKKLCSVVGFRQTEGDQTACLRGEQQACPLAYPPLREGSRPHLGFFSLSPAYWPTHCQMPYEKPKRTTSYVDWLFSF